MNTYDLTLSSAAPQPRIAGISQDPPITYPARTWISNGNWTDDQGSINLPPSLGSWTIRQHNSKGEYSGRVNKVVTSFKGFDEDAFRIQHFVDWDWTMILYPISPGVIKNGEKITFEIWGKSDSATLNENVQIGISEKEFHSFPESGADQSIPTYATAVSTLSGWTLWRAERIISFNEYKKPHIFFGQTNESVGVTHWTEPKIIYGNEGGLMGDFTMPDQYGATKLNLGFRNLYDEEKKFMKILVSHDQTDEVWLVQQFEDLYKVRAKVLPVYLYPTLHEVNKYVISVSAIRTDLQVERYDVNVNIKRPDITNYGDIDIVKTNLYNNKENSNNLFIAMETENPRYLINTMLRLPKTPSQEQDVNLTYFDPSTGQWPIHTNIGGDISMPHTHVRDVMPFGPDGNRLVQNPSAFFIKLHEYTVNINDGALNDLTDYMLTFDAKISPGQHYYAWKVDVGTTSLTGSWAGGKELADIAYPETEPVTHQWLTHNVPVSAQADDVITISMVSSRKNGFPEIATNINPVTGQVLSLRNIVLAKISDVNPEFVPVEF